CHVAPWHALAHKGVGIPIGQLSLAVLRELRTPCGRPRIRRRFNRLLIRIEGRPQEQEGCDAPGHLAHLRHLAQRHNLPLELLASGRRKLYNSADTRQCPNGMTRMIGRYKRELSVALTCALLLLLLAVVAPAFYRGDHVRAVLVSNAPVFVAAVG